jgi:hypothetical protein
MEDQGPDGSERRTAIFIAVALSLVMVTCLAGVAFVGTGAVIIYRLTGFERVPRAPHADPASPPTSTMADPPLPVLDKVQTANDPPC